MIQFAGREFAQTVMIHCLIGFPPTAYPSASVICKTAGIPGTDPGDPHAKTVRFILHDLLYGTGFPEMESLFCPTPFLSLHS